MFAFTNLHSDEDEPSWTTLRSFNTVQTRTLKKTNTIPWLAQPRLQSQASACPAKGRRKSILPLYPPVPKQFLPEMSGVSLIEHGRYRRLLTMLPSLAEYVWLDVLCLRQEGQGEDPRGNASQEEWDRREALGKEEWKVDLPIVGWWRYTARMAPDFLAELEDEQEDSLRSNENSLQDDISNSEEEGVTAHNGRTKIRRSPKSHFCPRSVFSAHSSPRHRIDSSNGRVASCPAALANLHNTCSRPCSSQHRISAHSPKCIIKSYSTLIPSEMCSTEDFDEEAEAECDDDDAKFPEKQRVVRTRPRVWCIARVSIQHFISRGHCLNSVYFTRDAVYQSVKDADDTEEEKPLSRHRESDDSAYEPRLSISTIYRVHLKLKLSKSECYALVIRILTQTTDEIMKLLNNETPI
ncbi:hypothetical protein EDD18DRAFT_1106053 [Armillaria luteobubalina]|uniref:Heterokaryon incompatibility domain-containing protein n=1 Tax=Armillaria luteobubalina TaxID=153913 RepID=A0AA39Q4M3_9AGAR|nr:hypothetical protein EDD18DRAFT_1106053 [Armillaria luteobubalina]